ncbi:peptidylprolyl isomerase [Arenibaculum pallidiluteum]|uniref:peptidylprolyl isomerase n=1 Tax=Arenibaculum pallidiluteum TaxID=2812559 RepID=UPI001A979366|nr:peptidylprolyl isomerase [Arenibaculum pallidiluteum]
MKLATVLRTATSAVALGGLLIAAASVNAQQPGQPAAQSAAAKAEDAVVAKVNGQEIRRSEVDRVIQGLPPQVQMMPPQMILPAVIDQVINGRLISQQGYKAGLQNDAEVKDRLKRAEERFVQEAYLTREVEKRITDQRLQEAYKKYLDEHPAEDEVKARHILVENEADAKQIIEDLKKGADFAKLSTEKSKDPGAAQQGGDLGWFSKAQMVEPFANAAFAMKPGETSQAPVQTQFGWHVIKVEDRRKTTPPTFDQVREELKSDLSEKTIAEMVDQLRTQATIERFPIADAEPAAPAAPAGEAQPQKKP